MEDNKYDSNTLMCILAHLLGYFTFFVGPLIVLLVSEEKVVQNHARLALNWQISISIYMVISLILILVLIGFGLLLVLGVLDLVFVIIASVKASENKYWNYPLAIPFF